MAECPYCHQSAGMMKKEHAECRVADEAILAAVLDAGSTGTVADLDSRTNALAKRADRPVDVQSAVRKGFGMALDRVLEDGVIDEDEEQRLNALLGELNLSQATAPDEWMRLVKALSLRDLLAGSIPQRIRLNEVPVLLQKGEQIAWAFPGTDLLEQRVQRASRTVAHGLSIRVARGVYYRPAVFTSTPVERAYTATIGRGTMLLTNKNLYFASGAKTLRIPYVKILSFEPFKDGLGIHRDAASAKPQIFVTGDGWFTYNMATNLAQLANA